MRLVEDAADCFKKNSKGYQRLSLGVCFVCSVQYYGKEAVSCFLPATDSYRISMRRMWFDEGSISYTDRKFRERDQAESGGCLLDFIFCMVFLEPVCAWKNQTDCKILAWSHSSYHTCDLSL